MESSSIGQRIEEIRLMVGMSLTKFAKYLNLSHNNYKIYLEGKSFEKTRLDLLMDLGFNPSWIISGKGKPFLENVKGNELRIKNKGVLSNSEIDYNRRNELLLEWIKYHFGSLEQYCDEKRYDFDYLKSVLTNDRILPTNLLAELKELGMNLKWIYGIEKDPYSQTDNGRFLRDEFKRKRDTNSNFAKLVEIK